MAELGLSIFSTDPQLAAERTRQHMKFVCAIMLAIGLSLGARPSASAPFLPDVRPTSSETILEVLPQHELNMMLMAQWLFSFESEETDEVAVWMLEAQKAAKSSDYKRYGSALAESEAAVQRVDKRTRRRMERFIAHLPVPQGYVLGYCCYSFCPFGFCIVCAAFPPSCGCSLGFPTCGFGGGFSAPGLLDGGSRPA